LIKETKMSRFRRVALTTIVALTLGTGGCTLSDDTISSLVDLAATTSGSFVEIVVRGAITAILTANPFPDLSAPLSEQTH